MRTRVLRRVALLVVLSACRVDCGPQPITPQARGKVDREPPPDVDRDREAAQWSQAYGGNGNAPNVPAGIVAGLAAGGLLTGAGVAVALHDGGAAPPPSDQTIREQERSR